MPTSAVPPSRPALTAGTVSISLEPRAAGPFSRRLVHFSRDSPYKRCEAVPEWLYGPWPDAPAQLDAAEVGRDREAADGAQRVLPAEGLPAGAG